eukprot:gene11151-23311_t
MAFISFLGFCLLCSASVLLQSDLCASANISPRTIARKIINAPVFATLEALKFLRDGAYLTTDIAVDVAKTIPTIPGTIQDFQSKAQSLPSTLAESINNTAFTVSNLPTSINDKIQGGKIIDTTNVFDVVYNTQRDVAQKAQDIQTAYKTTLKALSPSAVISPLTSTVRKAIINYYEMEDKKNEQDQIYLLRKQKERNLNMESSKKFEDIKETIYSTLDSAVTLKQTTQVLTTNLVETAVTFPKKIQSIPNNIESAIDTTVKDIQSKVDGVVENFVSFQNDVTEKRDLIVKLPSDITKSYLQTKKDIEALPGNIEKDIKQKQQDLASFTALCYRIITLQDLIASVKNIQNSFKQSTEFLTNVTSKKVISKPVIPKKENPIMASFSVISNVISAVKTFISGINSLKSRIDNEIKRQETREQTFQEKMKKGLIVDPDKEILKTKSEKKDLSKTLNNLFDIRPVPQRKPDSWTPTVTTNTIPTTTESTATSTATGTASEYKKESEEILSVVIPGNFTSVSTFSSSSMSSGKNATVSI